MVADLVKLAFLGSLAFVVAYLVAFLEAFEDDPSEVCLEAVC